MEPVLRKSQVYICSYILSLLHEFIKVDMNLFKKIEGQCKINSPKDAREMQSKYLKTAAGLGKIPMYTTVNYAFNGEDIDIESIFPTSSASMIIKTEMLPIILYKLESRMERKKEEKEDTRALQIQEKVKIALDEKKKGIFNTTKYSPMENDIINSFKNY